MLHGGVDAPLPKLRATFVLSSSWQIGITMRFLWPLGVICLTVLCVQSSSASPHCGTLLSHRDGALYNTSVEEGTLNITKRSMVCPVDEDGGALPPVPPQQLSRMLLQLRVNGEMHVLMRTEDAIDIFVYSEQGCIRRQRMYINGSVQECIFSVTRIVCVLLDQLHRRVMVISVIAPSTVDAMWNSTLLWDSEEQYNVQLIRPYLFANLQYDFHLVFGAGDNLVSYIPSFAPLPTYLGSIRNLYRLNSKQLLVDFGSSAYTYSLESAELSSVPYITSPLANYLITDFRVATDDANGMTAIVFNSTLVQVFFAAHTPKCALMQLPGNAQVKRIEFFSWKVLLLFVEFDNHSVLYTVNVDGIGQLLEEPASSCRNVSFGEHATPLLQYNDIGSPPCCGSFTTNDIFLFASNCNSDTPAVDLYLLDPVKYVTTLEGMTACELEAVIPPMNSSWCIEELASDSNTPLPTGVSVTPSRPTTTSPLAPSSSVSTGTVDPLQTSPSTNLIAIILAVVASLLAICIISLVVIIVCLYCSSGHKRGRYSLKGLRPPLATTNESNRPSAQDPENGGIDMVPTVTEDDGEQVDVGPEGGDEGIEEPEVACSCTDDSDYDVL